MIHPLKPNFMKFTSTIFTCLLTICLYAQDIAGSWKGSIEVPGMSINLVFHITKTADGYTTVMDSPDQGVMDVPMTSTSFKNANLSIEFQPAQITYTAVMSGEGTFKGTFKQGGASFPMDLKRGTVALNRPQEPKEPFPYRQEEVRFTNKTENFDLAGTLTLPQGKAKSPVVVLISGSGQQDRNSSIFGHKPFLVIADHLTRLGIAVLRFDDRGFGASKGDPSKATTAHFARDVEAAIAYLKTRTDIDKNKIGLIGHSEGGIIAPMVAAGNRDVAFIAILAGTGIAGDELLLQQNYQLGKLAGMPEADLQQAMQTNKEIYSLVKKTTDESLLKEQMAALLKIQSAKLPEGQKPSDAELSTQIAAQVNTITSPWMTWFIRHDPANDLKKVKVPVLVMNGEKDIQVAATTNVPAIRTALTNSGNKNVEVYILPRLNHLFQESETGGVEEYGKIEQTFAPVALQHLSNWILKQSK